MLALHPPWLRHRTGRQLRRAALVALVLSWLFLSVFFVSRLSVLERWMHSKSPFIAAEEKGSDPDWALFPERSKPRTLPAGKHAGRSKHLHLQETQHDPGPFPPQLPSLSQPPPPTSKLTNHAADTGKQAGAGNAVRQGAAGGASLPARPLVQHAQHSQQAQQGRTIWDERVSGLGPRLDPAQLHGGWQLTREVFDRAAKHPNATVVSRHSPRLVLVKGFLSLQEADHLVKLALGDMARSQVVSDREAQQDIRTSSGSWLTGQKRDAKALEIQDRIHRLIGIPEEFGESLYVLRYEHGQKYEAHNDACTQLKGVSGTESCRAFLKRAGGPGCGPGAGGITCGDRLATFIIYLQSPLKGGTTVFPKTRPQSLPELSAAGPGGLLTRSQKAATSAARMDSGSKAEAGGEEAVNYGGGDIWDIWGLLQKYREDGAGRFRLLHEEPLEGGAAPAPAPLYCDERAGNLQVAPGPGDALLFWDYAPKELPDTQDPAAPLDVEPDPFALHGGCPVLEGTKMIVTRWIRSAVFT